MLKKFKGILKKKKNNKGEEVTSVLESHPELTKDAKPNEFLKEIKSLRS
jgi:hypothetical protein